MTKLERPAIVALVFLLVAGVGEGYAETKDVDELARLRDKVYQKACLAVGEVTRDTALGTEKGCGFFVDDKGTMVTVLLTAADTHKITVTYGENEFIPKLLTVDPWTRLALLQVDGVAAPSIGIGRSTGLDVGDYAFAVRVADEILDQCVTGRVSGRDKESMGTVLATSVLRLNMKMGDHGFGAPLLDADAKVCGVVLLSMQNENSEVCYALPGELVSKVQRDYAKHGKVAQGWLGFGMEDGTTTPEIRLLNSGSPAAKAGLRVGDVIHRIGDRDVRDYQDVVDACYCLTPGETAPFRVLRGLKDLEIGVTPVVREERPGRAPLNGKVVREPKKTEPKKGEPDASDNE